MVRRTGVTLLLACAAFLPAGCGRGPGDAAAHLPAVTLYVEDMTARQGLT